MFGKKSGFPEEGDIVFCTVTKIYHHSVFVNLDEYGTSGMLHISEVSPGRIRNLRDYVTEGKRIVCKVLSVNKERGHVDVSLRRVTESQKRDKANDLKMEQIASRIIEAAAKGMKTEPQALFDKIAPEILKKFQNVPMCFEDVASDAFSLNDILDKDIAKELTEAIKTRIKPPSVEIGGYLALSTYHPEGANIIKNILTSMKERQMSPSYLGSGKYKLSFIATDYKTAEKKLKEAVDYALDEIKKAKGEGAFERIEA